MIAKASVPSAIMATKFAIPHDPMSKKFVISDKMIFIAAATTNINPTPITKTKVINLLRNIDVVASRFGGGTFQTALSAYCK